MRAAALALASVLLVALAAGAVRAQERITAGAQFGEWRMKCALNSSVESKSCSIWAGPLRANSPRGESTAFTLFLDPETPYAMVAARNGLFIRIQVDGEKAILADCTKSGLCELSREQAHDLFDQISRGEKLLLRIALLSGIYDRTLALSGYRAVLERYLEERRTYETSIHRNRRADGCVGSSAVAPVRPTTQGRRFR